MNANSFCTAEHIIAEVTHALSDQEFRNGFTKGWYMSRIQDALQELSFDSHVFKITRDLDYPSETHQMEMPENAFNVLELYGWNGSCCSPSTSSVIYPKRLYNNKGGNGTGYTARVKRTGETMGNDPFQPNYFNDGNFTNYPEAKYWYNIHNGLIMFSTGCATFQKIRIVYNGIGIEKMGDIPTIPNFFERAINDYIAERFYFVKMGQDPRMYASLYDRAAAKLNDYVNGNWHKAIKRVKMMDSSEVAAYNDYLANPYHK